MSNTQDFGTALFEGDGIGHEVTAPCVDLLERLGG